MDDGPEVRAETGLDRVEPARPGHRPLRRNGLTTPRQTRFASTEPCFEEAMAAHRSAVAAGEAGYLDPMTGLFVMTAPNLADRGWCCDRGCRHCPWGDAPAS